MPTTAITNRLLNHLPSVEQQHIFNACETVELILGEPLCKAEEPYPYVYFPLTGFISLLSSVESYPPLEMGLIGNEGMLGATLILGVDRAAMHSIVQGGGSALRVERLPFQHLLRTSPILLQRLNDYLFIGFAQLTQSATCTHFHKVEPRLARWLLMSHDRAHTDDFFLTHEFLASMLGVRRSSISIAANTLQQRGLIRYARGKIHILNRRGLEATSCECYTLMINTYTHLLGVDH